MKNEVDKLLSQAGYTPAQIKLIKIRAEQRAQKGVREDGRTDS